MSNAPQDAGAARKDEGAAPNDEGAARRGAGQADASRAASAAGAPPPPQPPPPPLAHLHGQRPPAPAWFEAALVNAPQRSHFDFEGAAIELLTWGPRCAPGLLLLHGNAAHADWYSFIAPLLADRYRVAAMSFSSMGGSGWRDSYSHTQWADEALAAAEHAGLFESSVKPLFVGHSFGGFPLMVACGRYGQRLAGVVIVDSPLRDPGQRAEHEKRRGHSPFVSARSYPTKDAAIARFRLIPQQPSEHLYIVDHIARTSLRDSVDEQGKTVWTWRFDPQRFKHFSFGQPHLEMAQARCPVTLVRGTLSSLVTPEIWAYAQTQAPAGSAAIEIAGAHHHVMIDQPLAFVQLLAELRAAAL